MRYKRRYRPSRAGWPLALPVIVAVALPLAACSDEPNAIKTVPYELVADEVDDINTVVLTQRASERLFMETTPVLEQTVDGRIRLTVPYAAIIYDTIGDTWVYAHPEPLSYRRASITIDYIDGDLVVLNDGPEPGTEVAITSVAELYGTDTGVGK
ncbi:MAG: hypothetical protein HKN03_04410 [Acidimicrobiales bacterium]|nr:hypothetical protein [Acidimicrobiales bacterium]